MHEWIWFIHIHASLSNWTWSKKHIFREKKIPIIPLFPLISQFIVYFPGSSDSKESACNAGDPDLIPGSGRSSGDGNGYPLQYSCLENSMDRGAWWAIVHEATKSQTQLSDSHTHIISASQKPYLLSTSVKYIFFFPENGWFIQIRVYWSHYVNLQTYNYLREWPNSFTSLRNSHSLMMVAYVA